MTKKFINIHYHPENNSEDIVGLRNIDFTKDLRIAKNCSIGLHPYDLKNRIKAEQDLIILKDLIIKNDLIAIGEIGLDRIKNKKNFDLQLEFFEKQLFFAHERNLIIIIHAVKSYADILNIFKRLKIPLEKVIFHGFNSSLNMAQDIASKGGYLSFGKVLLKSEKLQKVFKEISEKQIFLETDEEPLSQIYELYELASKIKGFNIKEIINNNYQRIIASVEQ